MKIQYMHTNKLIYTKHYSQEHSLLHELCSDFNPIANVVRRIGSLDPMVL